MSETSNSERTSRSERTPRSERSSKPERTPRTERSSKSERSSKPEKSSSKSERSPKNVESSKSERAPKNVESSKKVESRRESSKKVEEKEIVPIIPGKVFTVKDVDEYVELRNKGLVVVDFNTTWCGPCKNFAPIFEEIAKNYPDILFLSVDAESIEHEDSLSVSSVPTFKIFLNGVLKREFSGPDRVKLERYIDRYEIQILFNGKVQRSFPKEKKEKIINYMNMLALDDE